MNNWKKITLAAIMVTVAGFTYIKSSHRDIPSDLRDAMGDFDISIPKTETVTVTAPAPKATVLTTYQKWEEVRKFLFSRRTSRENDTPKSLFEDTKVAIKGYEYCFNNRVTYADTQDLLSRDFFMRTGSAQFNPNKAQTNRLEQDLDAIMGSKPPQAVVIFYALRATQGNVTLAMGSLAELFCLKRDYYIGNVRDMAPANGKNYYRFVGIFTGLHPAFCRMAGGVAAYANIVGNPIVYAGAEVGEWWADFFKGRATKDVNTLQTMGPEGNGNLVDKIPELNKGLKATDLLIREGAKVGIILAD